MKNEKLNPKVEKAFEALRQSTLLVIRKVRPAVGCSSNNKQQNCARAYLQQKNGVIRYGTISSYLYSL